MPTRDPEQELMEVIDEFVDDLDPTEIESEAERLGVTVDKLLAGIVAECKARLA